MELRLFLRIKFRNRNIKHSYLNKVSTGQQQGVQQQEQYEDQQFFEKQLDSCAISIRRPLVEWLRLQNNPKS